MSGDFPIEMLDRRRLNRGGGGVGSSASIRLQCEKETTTVVVRLPRWLVDALDAEAKQRDCSRNYLINLYLDESFADDPDHVPWVGRFERVSTAHPTMVSESDDQSNASDDQSAGGQ